VRVVRLMLAHGRVVVTMRHSWNGDDAVSPQNGTDGVPSRLTIRLTTRGHLAAAVSVVVMLSAVVVVGRDDAMRASAGDVRIAPDTVAKVENRTTLKISRR
jgi:hypothetical protein